MAQFPDYDSPASLKQFLDDHEMAMQKKFGQNFLVNRTARMKLIDALDIDRNAEVPESKQVSVWEVGPGLGAMTAEMLGRGASVTAFEIDRGFCAVLTDIFSAANLKNGARFSLVQGDVLKTWKQEYEKNGLPDRFFGNLPYNVAAAIIADMISAGARFEKAVVTVQKEVALRMAAKPGSEDYSSFSVLCQWAYDVTSVMDLAGGSFWPRPNVDSRAVKLTKKAGFPGCLNAAHFMKVQRALFASRRKTVKNNLAALYGNAVLADKVLTASGIDPQIRAEKLTLAELLHLSDASWQHQDTKDDK